MMDRWRKQSPESSRTEPSGTSPLASQTRGSSPLCGSSRSCCPSPGPGVGTGPDECLLREICLGWASGAKSHTLQRRESRPLAARAVRDNNHRTCRHLPLRTRRLPPPELYSKSARRACLLPPSYFGERMFYRSYLSKSCRVRKGF